MFLDRFFQNAYVTHDLDKALALVEKRFGVRDFIFFEPKIDLITPHGPKKNSTRVALAWVGKLQLEFIQPMSGYCDFYYEVMPQDKTDFTPRFHHICVRRDNLDEMRAEIKELNLPLVFESSIEGMCFIYLDARQTLGHYFEYIWATPEAWKMIGWPD